MAMERTRDQGPGDRDQGSGIRDQGPGVREKLKTKNQKPKTKNQKLTLMLLQIFIRLFDHQIILQALALEFVQIDHQGSSVLQGEPYPFFAGRRRRRPAAAGVGWE